MNLSLRLGAVSLCGLLATSSFADDARVRVVHASPDAPAVDVLVNGDVAFPNLAFTQSTMYAALPAGTYDVNVTAAGDPDASVIQAMLMLDADTDYSVVAVNTLANIEPLVLIDDNTRDPDSARIRFVHASPDAPAVDIALAGGDVLFGDIEFKEIGDYLAVPGGTYDLEVRLAGTSTVVLPLPGIQVSNDTVYTVFAMGFAFGQPALQAVIAVDAEPAPDARVRVVHASPDAPAVDVLVNGNVAFPNLAFTESTMYASLPEGTYDVNVTAAGDPDASVIEAMLMLDAGIDYSVIAVNTLANIEPLVLIDDNTRDPDSARIRFVHASPDAPAVDIALAGGDVLFGDIEFKGVGNYLSVPGGTYDLEVRLAGTNSVVLPLPGIQVNDDTVYTVFAMGFAFDQPSLQAIVTIDAGPMPLIGDINGNGMIDGKDLGLLLEDWGRAGSPADLNGDGTVDGQDLGLLLANWS